MRPIVIGLCGYAQVGKTTTANSIIELLHTQYQARLVPFAAPLKDLARDYFGWDGTKDERGRRLLQGLGTDVARAWDPDFWVKKWRDMAVPALDAGVAVIADDVRFPNEVAAVTALGGVVIHLKHSRGVRLDHASERPDTLEAIHMDMGDMVPRAVASHILSTWLT